MADNEAWKNLRSGLRVRTIIHAKRMHEVKCKATNVEQKKLIITRQLGFPDLMKGAAQWTILTKPKDECWVCGQWAFTLFIWTPRFGQLAMVKDESKIKHYVDAIKSNEVDDFFGGLSSYEVPHIGGVFNGWKFEKMMNLVDYCLDNDPNPPDFLQQMVDQKFIRQSCVSNGDALTDAEASKLDKHRRSYYKENWHKLILQLLPFKKPAVANFECLTSLNDDLD